MKSAELHPDKHTDPGHRDTLPPEGSDRAHIVQATADLLTELSRLQELLYAGKQHALLVILQGVDASGKDGTIRQVFRHLSPFGLDIQAFRLPSAEELAHDFLWRAHKRTPARGIIGIFNRSHYEAVLSDHVQGLCDDARREIRWRSIRDFEQHLLANDTVICKFFLNVSRDEQKKRLLERLADPAKQWKFSTADLETWHRFDDYMASYAATLNATHTTGSPWHVIPADHKWYRDYCVALTLVETLQRLAMEFPPLREKIGPEDFSD